MLGEHYDTPENDAGMCGTGSELIVMYHDDQQAEENMSTLSLGDQSYIMDLANQKQYRAELREEEAMEDALELFKTAVEEGAKKSVELFKQLLAEVIREMDEENREKDRLQDEWLEAALQEELDRQQRGGGLNVSNHTLSKSLHSRAESAASLAGPPSIYNDPASNSMLRRNSTIRMLDLDQQIYDEEKKILQKKIKKAERLIQEIVDEKGEKAAKETRKYKGLKRKLKEYRTTLKKANRDELRPSVHSKSVMYDWGPPQGDTAESEKNDDDDSSSSSGSSESHHSHRSSPDDDDDDDMEWAKQVVAKLTLNSNENLPKEVSVEKPATPETPKKRAVPHKNISFNTTMATTRRLSGHELMMKSRLGGVQPPLVKKPLTATKEEDELEESATALVSDGSTHTETTPKGRSNPPPSVSSYSPGKRKSPSWKKKDVTKSTPVKHVVSQDNLKKVPIITSPPLSGKKPSQSAKDSSSKHDGNKLYTLDDFQQGKVSGVDMAEWDQFLLPEEFEKHFEMSRTEFDKLPKWKQSSAKRRLRTWS